jgi:very-short-patch-repair endonuclease
LASSGNRNPSTRIEVREKISASMKKAHAEGRAWNIGKSRWNNEHSYPEKWLINVLKNEFGLEENKDYQTEFSFHRFSLDFAWPDRKICIEIDGEQHQRFQEQKQRDIEKDKLLKEEGWKELRKSWQDIFNNPKSFIEEVRNIIG